METFDKKCCQMEDELLVFKEVELGAEVISFAVGEPLFKIAHNIGNLYPRVGEKARLSHPNQEPLQLNMQELGPTLLSGT